MPWDLKHQSDTYDPELVVESYGSTTEATASPRNELAPSQPIECIQLGLSSDYDVEEGDGRLT